MTKPVVSVLCITYNHENFIEKCLEGFFIQKTDFAFEILIHDDASTDRTAEIIRKYEVKFPNVVKPIYQSINQYSLGKNPAITLLNLVQGTYVAVCEGDDYWTDPLKLQKQVDFLRSNSDYSMCFSSVTIDNQLSQKQYPEIAAENRSYSSDELLLTKTAHTVSFVFKMEYLQMKLSEKKPIFGGDIFLALLMAEYGKVYGMSDNMALYRIHAGGISNSDPEKFGIFHQKRFIKQFIFFKNTFPSLSKKAINTKIVDHCMMVAKYYYKRKNLQAAIYVALALCYRPDLISKGFKKLKV